MKQLIDLGIVDWVEAGRVPVSPIIGSEVAVPRSCPSYPQSANAQSFAFRDMEGGLIFSEVGESPPISMRESIRFFGPCVTSRCVHWSGHCNLGAALSRAAVPGDESATIGEERYLQCRIQDSCRWKSENGLAACRACASVDYFVLS